MPLPAAALTYYSRTFSSTCTPPSFPVGYPPSIQFQRPSSHQQYLGAPFIPFNPHLPACASVGAANYHPARQLIEIFGFSPFGIYCRICKDHVGSTKQMIKLHLESKGHGLFSKDALFTFEGMAAKKIELLLLSKRANLDEFLVGSSEGYACRCEAVFGNTKALTRHCKEAKSCSFNPNEARPELLYKTVCHRTISQATLDRLSVSPSTTGHFDFAKTEEAIKKYIRSDETIGPFIALFHPLCVSCGVNFDSRVRDMMGWWKTKAGVEELGLLQLLEAATTWIHSSVRRLVEMVPGNLRAALQVFDGQEVGQVAQNFLYNFRHLEALVLPEVITFLSFVWRHPSNLLASFKRSVNASDIKLVPAILQKLLLENVHGFNSHPLVMEYCLARCFRMKANNQVVMAQCGDNASIVAAVLSILRAGACSHIVLSDMSDQQSKDFVQEVRQSRVLNIISPMIRRFREMQRRKPPRRMTTVSPEGDIAVDGFEFPRDKWSKLVPTVLDVCRELLGSLFAGVDWMLFLDANTPLSVSRIEGGKFVFSLSDSGKEVKSSQLMFKQPFDHALIVDQLRSYVEIGFHGFGGGSMRYSELDILTLQHIRWHFGALYFSASSIKQYNSTGKNVTTTERKLPIAFARVYLLYDLAARRGVNDVSLLPACANRKHSMPDAIATIFNFSERPTLTQVRHLWTSVSNVTFPKGETVIVSATAEAAEMSGHTEATHEGRYGSTLLGGTELNYRKFHNALGAADGTKISNEKIQAKNLFEALTQIYGPDADFTSNLQREMVIASATENGNHSHVGLPCGSGKSLAWLLPLVASAMTSKKMGLQIVVLPYNFLVSHLDNSAREILQDKFDVSVVSLTTIECSESSLPLVLANDDHLPNLAFFGLDAFVSLHTYHRASLFRWARSGKIHRIFLDEIHTLFGELFREKYDHLRQIAQYGVPITTLSGTVPPTLVLGLSRYLNMANKDNDADVIVSNDLLGTFPPGFNISCGNFINIEAEATRRAKDVMSCTPQFGLHLICASKKSALRIFHDLSNLVPKYKIELVTADIPKEEQAEIARKWSAGEFDILVSTSSALVGNESSRCQAVFIVGYIFNLMSVVQAMGRLRPKQRKRTGCIEIFLNKMTKERWKMFVERDKTTCSLLVAKGIVAVTPENLLALQKVGTLRGIYSWATKDTGCRVVALSNRFGLLGASNCNVCDRCRGTPVAKMAAVAKTKVNTAVARENKALPVLKRLEVMCLVCGKVSCNGENCLGKGACFKCGGQHFSKNCTDSDFTSVLNSRACYSCLDLHDRRDYRTHDMKDCPLQKRLRRMFIEAWRKEVKANSRKSFVTFVTSNLIDNERFYGFVASYNSNVGQTK
jgi:superfamily II DNA helicase RecQ